MESRKKTEVYMEIQTIREDIDKIDDDLLVLLNKRAELAINVGRLKKEQGIPVYDPEREKIILERVTRRNTGPLDEKTVKILFERIIDESRGIERKVIDNNF